MTRFKVGDRVMTPLGEGTIIKKGIYSRIHYGMYVKMDVNPYEWGDGLLSFGTHQLKKLPEKEGKI